MFIKLQKTDGRPIWINAAFIVTVEPRKEGGSIVVPVGDGLDYDVKESAETVLSLLDGAPAPAILPVPCTDALIKAPVASADVPAPAKAGDENADAKPESAPAQKAGAKSAKRKTAATPRKRATGRKQQSEGKGPKQEQPAATKSAIAQGEAAISPVSGGAFGASEIDRLRKLAPRSVKKLRNTLTAQFKVNDVDGAIRTLESNGVLAVNRDHVDWK